MKKYSSTYRELTWLFSSLALSVLIIWVFHGKSDLDIVHHDTYFVVDFETQAMVLWSLIFLVVTIIRFFADHPFVTRGKKIIAAGSLFFILFLIVICYQLYQFADTHRGITLYPPLVERPLFDPGAFNPWAKEVLLYLGSLLISHAIIVVICVFKRK